MSERTELLPCPFCGGDAALKKGQQAFNDYEVWCNVCSVCGPNFGSLDEVKDPMWEAIAHWNTRA